jgi:ribosome-associated protein
LARVAFDKKAKNVLVLDLKGLTIIADYFVICSGESTTHVKAIAESIEEKAKRSGIRPLGIEGLTHSHWVLMDYGDVMIHIFEEETRSFYGIEKLWMDARSIPLGKVAHE